MLLTITNRRLPATDLGYLLHKNPARLHTLELSFGQAHVFYTEAREDCCTAALLVEVDPIALVRNRRGPTGEGRALEQYVNDRPYAASSFLSVALGQVFGTALSGRSRERQELSDSVLPLEVHISALPCRGGQEVLRRLFEPLGYTVTAQGHALDEKFPEWGDSSYFTVSLRAEIRLRDLLTHLYVLIPVLDNDKHYWISDDEVEKLLRRGGDWLAIHPEREFIVTRYLKHQRHLTNEALARLLEEDQPDTEMAEESRPPIAEESASLNEQRLGAVFAALKNSGAKRVLDLGCGEGKLLRRLLEDRDFTEIVGIDVSHRALQIAADRLQLDRLPERQRQRIQLLHGSLTYRDQRLAGFDAAAVLEVIEHLDPPRLAAFERVIFECARPATVVLTTPNVEYNVKFETLPAGRFRHRDHRFEWTRPEFAAWTRTVAERFGYTVRLLPVGPEDVTVGSPTQMGVFTR
jgi:3' terminal RNA ribose 2'-O-methyltransferase Hen1